MSPSISALIPARDEERRIGRCLQSLTWVDEVILLLDSRTSDATASVAARFPNVRVVTTEWEGYGLTKAKGVKHTRNEWVLWVDADEVITPQLRMEIEGVLAQENSCEAWDVPRLTWFINGWIHHCGWYPARVIRLFKKSKASFNDNVLHEGVDVLPGVRIGHLKENMEHYSYDSINQFFEKMVRYGPLGAEQALQKGKCFRTIDLVLRPLFTFFRFYFLRRGFLDGMNGFVVCLGSAFSTYIRYSHILYSEKKSELPSGDSQVESAP